MTNRTWLRSALAPLIALLLTLAALPAQAADPAQEEAGQAVAWLVAQQADNGSFADNAGVTADAVSALVAFGGDPNGVLKNGNSPVSYLGTQASSYATKSVAGAGKLMLAVVAAGKDPLSFGGVNLVEQVQKDYDAATGQYGETATDQAFALLALASVGQTVPVTAVAALETFQLPDGGWSYDGTAETGSDTNTTALAVQAFIATKSGTAALQKAQQYLVSQQNADGGFPYSKASSFGSDSDANSTANVMQALVALGVDPNTLKQGDNTPLSALVHFQNDNGAFRYQDAYPDDSALATAQAVPALLLKAFPLKVVNPEPAPAKLWLPLLTGQTAAANA